jgi:hypothetical protein
MFRRCILTTSSGSDITQEKGRMKLGRINGVLNALFQNSNKQFYSLVIVRVSQRSREVRSISIFRGP